MLNFAPQPDLRGFNAALALIQLKSKVLLRSIQLYDESKIVPCLLRKSNELSKEEKESDITIESYLNEFVKIKTQKEVNYLHYINISCNNITLFK